MLYQDGMAILLGKRRAIDDQGFRSCISKRSEHGKRFWQVLNRTRKQCYLGLAIAKTLLDRIAEPEPFVLEVCSASRNEMCLFDDAPRNPVEGSEQRKVLEVGAPQRAAEIQHIQLAVVPRSGHEQRGQHGPIEFRLVKEHRVTLESCLTILHGNSGLKCPLQNRIGVVPPAFRGRVLPTVEIAGVRIRVASPCRQCAQQFWGNPVPQGILQRHRLQFLKSGWKNPRRETTDTLFGFLRGVASGAPTQGLATGPRQAVSGEFRLVCWCRTRYHRRTRLCP